MLKVYGAQVFVRGLSGDETYEQARVIVAAKSLKEAASLVGLDNRYQFVNPCCGSETGNTTEIEIAMKDPGTVWATPMDHYTGEYTEVVLVTNCLRVVE